jgi:hypothetical protein
VLVFAIFGLQFAGDIRSAACRMSREHKFACALIELSDSFGLRNAMFTAPDNRFGALFSCETEDVRYSISGRVYYAAGFRTVLLSRI